MFDVSTWLNVVGCDRKWSERLQIAVDGPRLKEVRG